MVRWLVSSRLTCESEILSRNDSDGTGVCDDGVAFLDCTLHTHTHTQQTVHTLRLVLLVVTYFSNFRK